MRRYQILPCRIEHLRELAHTMRAADRAEIELVGLKPRHVLMQLWRASIEPKVAIIDGVVGAAWGDAAPVLATDGSMWAFTAPVIERVPLAFYREARREIADYLRVRHLLKAHVSCDYARALRFFAMLGFNVSDPVAVGNGVYREIWIERGST